MRFRAGGVACLILLVLFSEHPGFMLLAMWWEVYVTKVRGIVLFGSSSAAVCGGKRQLWYRKLRRRCFAV